MARVHGRHASNAQRLMIDRRAALKVFVLSLDNASLETVRLEIAKLENWMTV